MQMATISHVPCFAPAVSQDIKDQCFKDLLNVMQGYPPIFGKFLILENRKGTYRQWQWRPNSDSKVIINMYSDQLPDPFLVS